MGCTLYTPLPTPYFLHSQHGLGSGQAGDGDAEGGAAYVIHANLMTEGNAFGFAAVFATNPDFKVGFGCATATGANLNKLANAALVENLERIIGEQLGLDVVGEEAGAVVAAEAEGGLGEVVGAKAEEVGVLGDSAGREGGAGEFDHGANAVGHCHAVGA